MAATSANRAKKNNVPAYRLRKGYSQAIVTLRDSLTKKHKDFWLGEYGTPASYEKYHRVLAQWEASGRRWPRVESPTAAEQAPEITINELALAYWKHASQYYSPGAAGHFKMLLRLIRKFYGNSPASQFGPKDLRLMREAMIKGDLAADPPRKPWSRCYVNSQVHRLCRVFKWAASHEMVPIEVYHRLKSVPALRRNESKARETEAVGPVPQETIEAVRPFLSRQVRALVDLQLLTGARGGELFKLRPIDIQMDQKSGIWTVNLCRHKTSHLGKSRTLYFGPRAQKVIQPFLTGRPLDACLFSPAEAEQERRAALTKKRKTPTSCGNGVGENRVAKARKRPGDHYTASSYRKAIGYACAKARTKSFHPHQLRHNAATMIRREFGLEAARVILGHSSALVTDAVYAQRDLEQAKNVMRRIG